MCLNSLQRMRLLYSFRFQQIGDTWLAAATGQNAHLFNGVLQLNEVGHFIVAQLDKLSQSATTGQWTEQQLIDHLATALTHEYEVDEPIARQAAAKVLTYLQQEGVLL